MIRFRSWTGGQLAVFSVVLAFVGFLLFLGYRSWERQYRDEVESENKSFQSAIEACRSMTTEQCNVIIRPHEDAIMERLVEASRHQEKAGVIRLSLTLIDLIVIPGVVAYMAFQWFGAQRRGNGRTSTHATR
jgi:hypothetical protein